MSHQTPDDNASQLVYLGLGANLGQAEVTLLAAAASIAAWPEVHAARLSSRYRSAPIDSSGDDYVNAVMQLRTHLPALTLLDQLQRLELQHGRERPYLNAPRTLDLDLLLIDQQSINHPRLTVPHPRLIQRAFVLLPLLELDANLRLPDASLASRYLPDVAEQAIQRIAASQPIDYFQPVK